MECQASSFLNPYQSKRSNELISFKLLALTDFAFRDMNYMVKCCRKNVLKMN